jgi:hypothetical protein
VCPVRLHLDLHTRNNFFNDFRGVRLGSRLLILNFGMLALRSGAQQILSYELSLVRGPGTLSVQTSGSGLENNPALAQRLISSYLLATGRSKDVGVELPRKQRDLLVHG